MRCSTLLLLCVAAACGTSSSPLGGGPGSDDPEPQRRSVILMIGDGMGPGQLDAASLVRYGETGVLELQSLPVCGELSTASLSGITDSAASATAMATGIKTFNARIGMSQTGEPLETVVEWANERGIATGVVTTAALPHATPGAFTAHNESRHDMDNIAIDQATQVQPQLMLGGGAQYFGDDLVAELVAAGYDVVRDRQALADAGDKVWGVFADEHMDYVREREPGTGQPTLAEMSLAALARLDRDPDGFFLMIEGARIDMASHANDIENAVYETLDFDDTVAAVRDWASDRDDVLLIVTADHECGGLTINSPGPVGQIPQVSWRWGNHTNARVSVCASGPGSELFHGSILDHTWVHAATMAHLSGTELVEPTAVITPDGRLGDLRHDVAVQLATSEFGQGVNELRALRVDANSRGLAIGIEGVFQWQKNAVVVLIDADYGAETGVRDVAGELSDTDGRVDSILSSLPVMAAPGFGAELAAVSWGAQDARVEDLWDDAGLRGLVAPYGDAADLSWYGIAATFGEPVRSTGPVVPGADGEGLEFFVTWDPLYPDGGGAVPVSGQVAIAVVLTNDDGGFLSNQALPSFAADLDNPGRSATLLPGVVIVPIDADGDGVGDGDAAPSVLMAQ